MMLIEEATRQNSKFPKSQQRQSQKHHKIRLVANAAGGLLPSVSNDLKLTFGPNTIILPAYGMTECMPISCPPVNYNVRTPTTQ